MTYADMYQQTGQQNPQWAGINPQQLGQTLGQSQGQQFGSSGQSGFGQPLGQAAYGQFGQTNIGGYGQNWMQQRQLSQQDVSEVVRQLVPLLPQVLAQAQQPQIGYGAYGQTPRLLSQQDINEVVRQILPIVPQIVAVLQGQSPWQTAAAYGGWGHTGQQTGIGYGQTHMQNPSGLQNFQGFGQTFPQQQHWQQQPYGQFGTPQMFAAFGNPGTGGQSSQRQLTQHDINDVVRQLIGAIPQVMGNLQTHNQQRPFN